MSRLCDEDGIPFDEVVDHSPAVNDMIIAEALAYADNSIGKKIAGKRHLCVLASEVRRLRKEQAE